MKRMISLIFALVLALSAVCGTAVAEKTFKTAYFTVTLPAGWDYSTDDAEKMEDGDEYLGYFGEDKEIGLIVGAYIIYYEDLTDISLWNSDEAGLREYAESIMYDFADDDPEYLGIVMAGKIPFVLIRAENEDGEYLYADTMTNGYAIEFNAYVLDSDGETQYPITEKYIEQFKSVLATFQPVS